MNITNNINLYPFLYKLGFKISKQSTEDVTKEREYKGKLLIVWIALFEYL